MTPRVLRPVFGWWSTGSDENLWLTRSATRTREPGPGDRASWDQGWEKKRRVGTQQPYSVSWDGERVGTSCARLTGKAGISQPLRGNFCIFWWVKFELKWDSIQAFLWEKGSLYYRINKGITRKRLDSPVRRAADGTIYYYNFNIFKSLSNVGNES